MVLNCPNLKTFVVREGSLESIGVIQIDAIGESIQFEVESNGLKNVYKIEYSFNVSKEVVNMIKMKIESANGHVKEIVTEKIEPTTIPPTTEVPTTIPPTEAPTTIPPTTEVPTTIPSTETPTTEIPTTETPTTLSPYGCHKGQIVVQLKRVCAAYSYGESFMIYEGTQDKLVGQPIYQQSHCRTITTSICMNPTVYTIVMEGPFGNIWPSNSAVILSHDNLVKRFSCKYRYYDIQMFNAETLEQFCSEGYVAYKVVREYGASPSSSERLTIYYNTGGELASIAYNGVATDAYIGCMKPDLLRLELSGATNGWNSDSYFTIESEFGVSEAITLQGSSSNILYFYKSYGLVSFTEVTSCNDFNALPDNMTMIHMTNNACNDASIVEFSTTRFSDLVYLWIGDENFMYVKAFNVQNNSNIQGIHIQRNSFTQRKDSYGYESSKSFHILNCGSLEYIHIDRCSFSDFAGEFEMQNLPQLQSIQIGSIGSYSYNFYRSSFVIRGIDTMLNI